MNTEYEQGTSVGAPRHRHNGYYAGDFSGRPLPTGLRRDLMALPGQPGRQLRSAWTRVDPARRPRP